MPLGIAGTMPLEGVIKATRGAGGYLLMISVELVLFLNMYLSGLLTHKAAVGLHCWLRFLLAVACSFRHLIETLLSA